MSDDLRGYLASSLKCWHRLTGEEADELVHVFHRQAMIRKHAEAEVLRLNGGGGEAVAWISIGGFPTVSKKVADGWVKNGGQAIPLYTAPQLQQAEPVAVLEGWRPIETAPKDFSTEFDGWNGERVPDIIWGQPEHAPKGEYAWCRQEYEQHYGWVLERVNGLTHWMPLPTAPSAPKPQGE